MPTAGTDPTSDERFALHERMMAEARSIVDAARACEITLRLTGGLAVRRYCVDLRFADREYGDIDMIGLSSEVRGVCDLFARMGFLEDPHVAQATLGMQRQYSRPPDPGSRMAGGGFIADHVDVFLDQMAMDHVVELRGRLELDDFAISASDALLTKLQIFRLTHKDVHDVIALVKDVPLARADEPGAVNVRYIADLCAEDWGLSTDVQANIEKVLNALPSFDLRDADYDRVKSALTAVEVAMNTAAKTVRWRLRARIGKRMAWHREVEEQGAPAATEGIWGERG
jgi:hypothetical protein